MSIYEPLVIFENVGLRYQSLEHEIIKDLTLTINKKDFLFLVGESGSGKSTFLNLVNTSLSPTRGYLNILGYDVNHLTSNIVTKIRQKIGSIFQDYRLINHISVYENIAMPLKILKFSDKEINEKTNEMLNWIGLKDFANNMPYTLSGGQQQRVAIARAVIHNPEIILADEPTGSVDPVMGEQIFAMLEYMNNQDVTVIFATHNLDLVEKNTKYPVLLIHEHKIKKIER